jgi:tRNA nucleotidyltransferase/poly(A) polymerase
MDDFITLISRERADKHITDLSNYIDHLNTENKSLRNQVDNWNKDKVIQELQEEIRLLRNVSYDQTEFSISTEELATCREWEQKHMHDKHRGKHFGCIGGNFTYCLTPTSIGTVGKVKCSCGEEFEFRELG